MRTRTRTRVLPRKSPVQARAQSTIDVILEAAARILAKHGPDALNTNAIAEQAGVSIGSLYEYFPSKEAIVVALARRQLESGQTVESAISGSAGKPIADRARAVVRALIAVHRADEDVRRVTMTSHRAHGFWFEHEQPVRSGAEMLATDSAFEPWSRVAIFVLTRAVVGAVRAAACEDPRRRRMARERIIRAHWQLRNPGGPCDHRL